LSHRRGTGDDAGNAGLGRRSSERRRTLDRRGVVCNVLEREREDLLALAVLEQLEIIGGQALDNRSRLVADDHVDEHEVDAGSEHRRLRRRGRLLLAAERRAHKETERATCGNPASHVST
jgi:hypothetical protein